MQVYWNELQWNPVNATTFGSRKVGRINGVGNCLTELFFRPEQSGRNNKVVILTGWS